MSKYQCAHKGCGKDDNLIGIGSPPHYYCVDHFELATRKVAAFIRNAWQNANNPPINREG